MKTCIIIITDSIKNHIPIIVENINSKVSMCMKVAYLVISLQSLLVDCGIIITLHPQ